MIGPGSGAIRALTIALAAPLCTLWGTTAHADTVVFFDVSQVATPVASGVTSDTIASEGYLFTYTRDKLFTGGGMTDPIGRPVRIPWPQGVEAQAVTAGPNPGKARITLERVDGDVFDLTAFTARLLANTAGTGGSFEVVAFLNGQEGFNDPLVFDASGIAGNTFSYDTSPNPLGSTALLTGFDKYTIDLFVDFALVGLAVEGAPIPEPSTFSLLALGVIALALRSRAGSGLRAAATRGSGTALTTVSVAKPGREQQIG